MSTFLISAAVSLVIAWTFICMRPILRSKTEDGVVLLNIPRVLKLTLQPPVFAWVALLTILLVAGLFAILLISELLPDYSGLYQTTDVITSNRSGKILLGTIFGVLFAPWLIRIYSSKNKTVLSLKQKVESGILLVLFIAGILPVPQLLGMINNAEIDTGIVKFQFSTFIRGNETETESDDATVAILEPSSQSGNTLELGAIGVEYIRKIPGLIDADIKYVAKFAPGSSKSFEAAKSNAKKFENIQILSNCLFELAGKAGDSSFMQSQFLRMVLPAKIIHQQSLSIYKEEIQVKEIDAGIFGNVNHFLTEITEDTILYYKALHPSEFKPTLKDENKTTKTEFENCNNLAGLADPAGNPSNMKFERIQFSVINPYIVELPTSDMASRPYFAITLAALLTITHQELAAISVLDKWIDTISTVNGNTENVLEYVISTPHNKSRYWSFLRIIGVKNAIYNAYFERTQSKVPTYILDMFLKSLQTYDSLIDNIPEVASFQKREVYFPTEKKTNFDGKTLLADNFKHQPEFTHACPFVFGQENPQNSAHKMNIGFILGRQSTRALFAFYAILHPRYAELYVPKVKSIISELVNIDYSCLQALFPPSPTSNSLKEINLQRAEVLSTYADIQIANVRKKTEIGESHDEWAKETLVSAHNALSLARSMIAEWGNPQNIDARNINKQKHGLLLYGEQQTQSSHAKLWEKLTNKITELKRKAKNL